MEGTGKEKYTGQFASLVEQRVSSRYDAAQTALEDKKKRTKAGLDTPSGAGKMNKGGAVMKYNMGGKVPGLTQVCL